MTRSDAANAQKVLMELREATESDLIVGFGAHAPTSDTRQGSVSATVTRDDVTATAEAVHLVDAILLARADVERQIKARDKKRAEAAELIA